MSCVGKEHVSTNWITNCFLQKCAWNVLVFKKNHIKVKSRVYSYVFLFLFHMFHMLSLKFLFANWDVLIPFLLVSYFCFKSKKFFFQFLIFVLRGGPLLATKSGGPGVMSTCPYLKPPVMMTNDVTEQLVRYYYYVLMILYYIIESQIVTEDLIASLQHVLNLLI